MSESNEPCKRFRRVGLTAAGDPSPAPAGFEKKNVKFILASPSWNDFFSQTPLDLSQNAHFGSASVPSMKFIADSPYQDIN
jgi:hypothetical protein